MKYLFSATAIILFCCSALTQSNGVSINSSGDSPHPSAMLDVSGASKGVLINRMTTVERDAIVNPAIGLLIFNTSTSCLNMWSGSTWKQSCFDCDFSSPLAGNSGPICVGGSLQLTAATIPGATYQWAGPNGFTSTEQNPLIENATAGASGSYTVTATLNGCTSQPQQTIATVNTPPDAPIAQNDGPVCTNSQVQLSASFISGATYSWTGPNGYTASGSNPTITNTQTTHAGTYYVTASVNGCNSNSGSTSVVVITPPPSPGTISGNSSVCGNSTGNAYSISPVEGATSYNWTLPAGSSFSSNTGTSVTVTAGTTSGNISVAASNSCGSSSPSSTLITITSGGSGSQTFSYTGAPQTFTVPACVYSISITAYGAEGWSGTHPGGKGASATGNLAVTPGQQLYVYAGGQGTTSIGSNVIMGGGWNGGGHGMNNSTGAYCGGGGGGSDVRTVFDADPMNTASLNSRVIVAGGGGGATNNTNCFGGNGGGTAGLSGGYCCGGTQATGGTQTTGGNLNGAFGRGGNAQAGLVPWIGGGGGGWYGGGTSTEHSAGGGGSSYIGGVTGGSMVAGINSGNGSVQIAW